MTPITQPRRTRLFIFLLLLVLTIVLIFLLRDGTLHTLPLSISPKLPHAAFDGRMLVLEASSLNSVRAGEKPKLFAQTVSGNLVTGKRFAAVYSPKNLRVYNTLGKEVLRRDYADQTLLAVRLGQSYIGVLLQNADKTVLLDTFNASGGFVGELALQKSTVLDFGYFGQGTQLWLSRTLVLGQTPVTMIEVYQGQSLVAKTQVGEIVLRVLPMDDTLYLCCISHLAKFDISSGEQSGEQSVHGWRLLGNLQVEKDQALLLCPISTQGDNASRPIGRLWIYRFLGEGTYLDLPQSATCVLTGEKGFWVFSKGRVTAYDAKGVRRGSAVLTMPVNSATLIAGKEAWVISQNTSYYVQLP